MKTKKQCISVEGNLRTDTLFFSYIVRKESIIFRLFYRTDA